MVHTLLMGNTLDMDFNTGICKCAEEHIQVHVHTL